MLGLFDPHTRRNFLQVGALGLGGLSLPQILQAAEHQEGVLRDRSVVFLFMHGGPPQTETFDPKMSAPSEYRCFNGEIATSVPGLTYGASMVQLAKLAHRTSIVRSFTTGDGAHNIKPIVSRYSLDANVGSLCSRITGITDQQSGLPVNAALFPRAVNPDAQPANKSFGNFADTGKVGSAYAPFVPSGDGPLLDNMKIKLPQTRIDDRRALLESLDGFRRELDSNQTMQSIDKFNRQAYDVILGSVSKAFDLSEEDPKLIERYDTSKLVPYSQIDKKWNNHKNYRDHVHSLGKLMLLARRLCERGSRFVTVTTNFVWDFHADQNNAHLSQGMQYVGHPFDHAVSAFINDVEARGLRDKILLVCCGEMGRTPKINKKGGRDHWGRLAPLLVYGGGLKSGQVVGQSDAHAGEPNTTPITIKDLIATILHSQFDRSEIRLRPNIPAPVLQLLESGDPISQLV